METVARNLNVTLFGSFATNDYRGTRVVHERHDQDPVLRAVRAPTCSRGSGWTARKVRFDRIDLLSDGARSVVDGVVDFNELAGAALQREVAASTSRCRRTSSSNANGSTASGQADFDGTFRIFPGGRELKGSVHQRRSLGVNAWRFPNLSRRRAVAARSPRGDRRDERAVRRHGAVRLPHGAARQGGPTRAMWDVNYQDVDLPRLTDFLEPEGMRLAGRATGRNRLTWPLGKWALKRGDGEVTVQAPAGARMMTRELPGRGGRGAGRRCRPRQGPSIRARRSATCRSPARRLPLDPEWITLARSWMATPKTYVEFEGPHGVRRALAHPVPRDQPRLAGERPRPRRHHDGVRRADRRDPDRRPRRVRRRDAQRRSRSRGSRGRSPASACARGTSSGARAAADLVIENSYATSRERADRAGDSRDRRRRQVLARVSRARTAARRSTRTCTLTRRPLADLRHAFELDD